ncbi:hypothetical protein JCM3775_002097 [Rhodotorula graminis]
MAEPLSSWSLSRHLSRFHRAADAKTVPVAAMKHRIEAFMQYWDGRSGSWSTLVPGGDELWTGRIDFPGEADDMFLVMEKKPVVVHDADVLLTGVLHGARVPFCSVPSLGETARSTIEVPRTDAAPDRWQFLRLEGEGGAPSAASWRFLGVRGDPKSDVTSFALEGPSDRIAAFVRQPDGGELFAFRGVGSGVDEAEVVELPTAPHAARSFVVSLQGTWRLVTPQHAVRTCVPDSPRPISSPSSALAPAHPDTWTLARRTLSRQSRRLVSTTWTVSLSAVVLASASSSAAAAGRCSVTFRADDPHEVRAREGGDHGAGRGIASGGGRERLPVWAEMTSGRR